jgi:hypothetical protein
MDRCVYDLMRRVGFRGRISYRGDERVILTRLELTAFVLEIAYCGATHIWVGYDSGLIEGGR